MKSLEEVIEAEEICSQMDADCSRCPYKATAKGWCEEKDRDALHYLKEYRDLKSTMDWHAQMEEIRNSIENVPLTWDELKQMIDSIVWLEWSSDGNWAEIIHATDDEIEYFRFGTDELCYIVRKDYAPDKWQAYMKERI